MAYEKLPYELGGATTVLECNRLNDKQVKIRRNLPGNIIVVHGVNDVGTSYRAVEEGLCQGLTERLHRGFLPGSYVYPSAGDKDKVLDDPDAVYYKRTSDKNTNSPLIPFYWGYREIFAKSKTVNGQKVDQYGNRLDKDLSKGGGPFGNATSTLPDMWNRGIGAPVNPSDDATRPLKTAPGRMYMVLAARRLMALISMIREYDENEVVTIVAHSQGCMLALLAQAFLMEQGLRPADTLILTHPPYSLLDDTTMLVTGMSKFQGGEDAAMAQQYAKIGGRQTLHGRLQTLVNIVHGVTRAKRPANAAEFTQLGDETKHKGIVAKPWKAEADRDNRGKVYLYFCPEDMTVALENIQGIGWQGVPDMIDGTEFKPEQELVFSYETGKKRPTGPIRMREKSVTRLALSELGPGFFQRVFTAKQRLDPATRRLRPVLVGLPPHDFALRLKGEDDHAHVEASGRTLRASLPIAAWPIDTKNKLAEQRHGIRSITGEALRPPVPADLRGGEAAQKDIPKNSPHARLAGADRGPCEEVDPLDATTAVASGKGLGSWPEILPDPSGMPRKVAEPEPLSKSELKYLDTSYNETRLAAKKTRDDNDKRTILFATRMTDGSILAQIEESPNEGRLRWQHEVGAKSFHGAIIGSSANHRQVTAYDVAIGGGKASTDPKFYAYLCAVADWRLKQPNAEVLRPGIPLWDDFLADFGVYWKDEPRWRYELIAGNSDYYSTGVLPSCLPTLTGKLWEIVVSETIDGVRLNPPKAANS